jgi:hypothetical protein
MLALVLFVAHFDFSFWSVGIAKQSHLRRARTIPFEP